MASHAAFLSARIQASSSLGNSSRYFTSRTSSFNLPVRTIDVTSLLGNVKHGKLIEHTVSINSIVETGDAVAIVETDLGERCVVNSPESGRVTQFHYAINDVVSVGDSIVSIDTDYEIDATDLGLSMSNDAVGSSSKQLDPNVKMLIDYIQANQGKLDDEFLDAFCNASKDDLQKIRAFALMIRDQFPDLAPKSKRVFEFLRREQSKPENKSEQLEIATTYTDIGITHFRLNELDEAISNLENALTIRLAELGPKSPELVGSYIHLGAVRNQKGDLNGTYEVFLKAYEIQKLMYPENTPDAALAATLNSLGAVKYQMEDYSTALSYYKQAVAIQEKTIGTKHPETAGCYNNIGIALKFLGDNKNAIDYCTKALKIRQDVLGNNHNDTASSHYTLAQMFTETGKLDDAIEQYHHTIRIYEQSNGKDSPFIASLKNNLGGLFYQSQKYDLALQQYRESHDIFQSKYTPNHPEVANCLNNMAFTFYQQNKYDEALENHMSAYKLLSEYYGDDRHPSLAPIIGSIGNVKKMKGQFEEALTEYRKAHVILENSYSDHIDNHPEIGTSYNNMGQALAGLGKYSDALIVYNEARSIFEKSMGSDHPNYASCCFNIGLIHRLQNNKDEARKELMKALTIWSALYGPIHPQVKITQKYIVDL
jgi:tetratricopeptide (TPR) repeat protein